MVVYWRFLYLNEIAAFVCEAGLGTATPAVQDFWTYYELRDNRLGEVSIVQVKIFRA